MMAMEKFVFTSIRRRSLLDRLMMKVTSGDQIIKFSLRFYNSHGYKNG